jgi:hypothetical protein
VSKPIEVIQCRTGADVARCTELDQDGKLATGADPSWQQILKQMAVLRAALPPGFTIEQGEAENSVHIVGPDLSVVYYPLKKQVEYRGRLITMRARTVVRWLKTLRRRQAGRLANDRADDLEHLMPPGFRIERLHNGWALRVTGPNGFKVVWYPLHQRVQFHGQFMTMRLETVATLLHGIAERASGVRQPGSSARTADAEFGEAGY